MAARDCREDEWCGTDGGGELWRGVRRAAATRTGGARSCSHGHG